MRTEEFLKVIERMRAQGTDDAQVEAKACSEGLSTHIWESVSAFANTHGGTLMLGLSEEEGFTPAKGFDLDKVLNQFVSGIGDGGGPGKLHNPPQYDIERHALDGEQVLVIELSEVDLQLKPCYMQDRGVQNGSYKRVDDKDIRLSPTEVYELQNALVRSEADGTIVPEASESDLEEKIVDGIIAYELSHGSRSVTSTDNRSDRMKRLRITNGTGGVRLAGLLAAGSYPQEFYPKLVIDVAAHPGTSKAPASGPRFLDRKICDGPLPQMIDDAMVAIARNLKTYSVIEGAGRRDELEIPSDVLREALANAVIHREYGDYFKGQSVSVDIYSDRLVITNPGGLWGGKTEENLADGMSCCRNDALMRLMTAAPLPGGLSSPAEGQGSGVQFMINQMRARALQEPRFKAGIDSFSVTLYRGGAEIDENRKWLLSRTSGELDPKEEAVLLSIRRNPGITVSKIHAELGYDSDEIRGVAKGLVSKGLAAQSSAGGFSLANKRRGEALDDEILATLSQQKPLSTHDLSKVIDTSLPNLRAHLRKLVSSGKVVATAPPQSRNRAYRLP